MAVYRSAALFADCVIEPGVYFATNSPPGLLATTREVLASAVTALRFLIDVVTVAQTAQRVDKMTIISRASDIADACCGDSA
jgi:carbon starvation protein